MNNNREQHKFNQRLTRLEIYLLSKQGVSISDLAEKYDLTQDQVAKAIRSGKDFSKSLVRKSRFN